MIFSKLSTSAKSASNAASAAVQAAETVTSVKRMFDTVKSVLAHDATADDDVIDNVVSRLEDLVTLLLVLNGSPNITASLAVIHLYLKTWCPKSTFILLKSFLDIELGKLAASKGYYLEGETFHDTQPFVHQSSAIPISLGPQPVLEQLRPQWGHLFPLFARRIDAIYDDAESDPDLPLLFAAYLAESFSADGDEIISEISEFFASLYRDLEGDPDEGFSSISESSSSFEQQTGVMYSMWRSSRKSPLAKFMRHAVTVMALAGVLPEKATSKFGSSMYEYLNVKVDKDVNNFDFLDMCFQTLDFTVEKLYPAVLTNNMLALLDADDLTLINADFIEVRGACDAFHKGQMSTMKKEFNVATDVELLHRIDVTIAIHKKLSKTTNDSFLRKELTTRLLILNQLHTDTAGAIRESPLRQRPATMIAVGESAVAKSLFNQIANDQMSFAIGLTNAKDTFFTLDPSDEYHSGAKSHHTTCFMDEIAQTRPERETKNPLKIVFDLINNVPFDYLSPIAELKGILSCNLRFIFGSTNNEQMNAHWWCINDVAMLRRWDYYVSPRLKKEAMTADGYPLPSVLNQDYPDAWIIDVKHVKIVRAQKKGDADTWEWVNDLQDSDLYTVMDFLKKFAIRHTRDQEALVENMKNRFSGERCLEHGWLKRSCEGCKRAGALSPSTILGVHASLDALADQQAKPKSPFAHLITTIDSLPSVEEETADDCLVKPYEDDIHIGAIGGIDPGGAMPVCASARAIANCRRLKNSVLALSPAKLPKATPYIMGLGLVLAGWGIFKVYSKVTAVPDPNSPFESDRLTQQEGWSSDVKRPPVSDTARDDIWRKVEVAKPDLSLESLSSSLEKFMPSLRRNIGSARLWEFDAKKDERIGDATVFTVVPLGNSDWQFPGHVLEEGILYQIEVSLSVDPEAIGCKRFSQLIDSTCWTKLGSDDYAGDAKLVRLADGGDVIDFSKFMIESKNRLPGAKIQLHGKHAQKGMYSSNGVIDEAIVVTYKDRDIQVASYNLEFETFQGMCGAPVVTWTKSPAIVGFHIMGNKESPNQGYCSVISRDEVVAAKARLSFMPLHNRTPLDASRYSKEVLIELKVHAKNPVHFMPVNEDVTLEIVGQHDQPLSSFRSSVTESVISPLVTKHLGISNKFVRPPTDKPYLPFRNDLKTIAEIKRGPIPALLETAGTDMMLSFTEWFVKNRDFAKEVCVLNYEDALLGIDGVQGIDKIDTKTSTGWAFNTQKIQMMIEKEFEGRGLRYDFDCEKMDVQKAVFDIIATLKKGDRVNTLFRSCLKDEALKPKKAAIHKIRVFSASEVAFSVVTRMFFLPFMAARKKHPTLWESAVGCNAHGKDWELFQKFVTKDGELSERMFNGDYKSYDKDVMTMLLQAVFGYYIRIYDILGFDAETMTIMRGIATEISCPCIEMKGVILRLRASNPSGHPLTVELNNDINRLLLRYCYYAMHDKMVSEIPLFHKQIRLLCYGDDNLGSVAEDELIFNHTTLQRELSKIGITYTMADKDSESVPFIPLTECDFLKRTFTLHEETGAIVGPLAIPSIGKSLHMAHYTTKDTTTVEELAAVVLGQSLDEFFLHGRDVFEEKEAQIASLIEEYDSDTNHESKISDFYRPPTFASLVERYNNTTSVMDLYG